MRAAALFLLALSASTAVSASYRPSLPRSLLHPSHSPGSSIRYRKAMSSWSESPSSVPSSTRTFSPVDFGGDPTGVADSTAAIAAAVSALLNASRTAGVRDANGILDCGGSILDLQGGEYLTSSPLVIPAYYGNLEVRAGTLRASASFPVDRFLVEVGRGGQLDGNNVDVSLSGLFLDASQVALGCINATGLFGGVIGPQIYAFNFTGVGIEVLSGHEVTVMQTWVGEYWWSDKRKENGTASTAVGIRVDGNDHIVDDVIVFSSHVGLEVTGGANLISTVHTWNLANGNNGTGILVNTSQARLVNVYLDWTDLRIVAPPPGTAGGLARVTVTDSFFLCGGRIQLLNTDPTRSSDADGILIDGAQFIVSYCHFSGFNAVEAVGLWGGQITDVTVQGILAEPGVGVTSTVMTTTVSSATPTKKFTANFTSLLLFDVSRVPIQTVTYALVLADGATPVPAHAVRPIEGGIVTVETSSPVAGSVTITVDQSKRRGPA
jgi:hypothetical protein